MMSLYLAHRKVKVIIAIGKECFRNTAGSLATQLPSIKHNIVPYWPPMLALHGRHQSMHSDFLKYHPTKYAHRTHLQAARRRLVPNAGYHVTSGRRKQSDTLTTSCKASWQFETWIEMERLQSESWHPAISFKQWVGSIYGQCIGSSQTQCAHLIGKTAEVSYKTRVPCQLTHTMAEALIKQQAFI